MKYVLSKHVKIGEYILLGTTWYKVLQKHPDGVLLDNQAKFLYGAEVQGWKIQ